MPEFELPFPLRPGAVSRSMGAAKSMGATPMEHASRSMGAASRNLSSTSPGLAPRSAVEQGARGSTSGGRALPGRSLKTVTRSRRGLVSAQVQCAVLLRVCPLSGAVQEVRPRSVDLGGEHCALSAPIGIGGVSCSMQRFRGSSAANSRGGKMRSRTPQAGPVQWGHLDRPQTAQATSHARRGAGPRLHNS